MLPDLCINIKFYPVGHGLFTFMALHSSDYNFNIVFDCGSHIICREALEKSLNDFLAEKVKKIDLLVISHLHYDHVSGLVKLLSEVKVDTVVLPYIFPNERLFIAASQGFLRDMPLWYFSFLSSPASFLANLGVREIRFLRGTGKEKSPEFPYGMPFEGPRDKPIRPKVEWSKMMELDMNDKKICNIFDRNVMNFILENLDTRIYFHNVGEYAYILFGKYPCIFQMFLVFHVYPVNDNALEKFRKCIEEKFGLNTISIGDILRILSEYKSQKKLRQCYRELAKDTCGVKDINFTSLSLLMALESYNSAFMLSMHPPILNRVIYTGLLHPYSSLILLTGDVRLDKEDIWSSFRQRYENLLKNKTLPFIFQVPHHGSSRGFKREILKLISPSFSIVSCSMKRFSKLPSRKVLGSLSRAGYVELCNEHNPIKISLFAYCQHDIRYNKTRRIFYYL